LYDGQLTQRSQVALDRLCFLLQRRFDLGEHLLHRLVIDQDALQTLADDLVAAGDEDARSILWLGQRQLLNGPFLACGTCSKNFW
jgi:hypothetical protein